MIKLLIAFLLSASAYAKVNLELAIPASSVKQGEIVEATLRLLPSDGQVQLQALKGKNLANTLYFLNLSPLMKKDGQSSFEAEAKIIFSKVPETGSVSEKVNGEEVEIRWGNVQVIPTEAEKSFLLGDFEIPEKLKLLPWIAGGLGLLALLLLFLTLKKKISLRKAQKQKRLQLRDEVLNVSTYSDVVNMWKKKREYLAEFPALEPHFQKLEETLFKSMFKPQQSEIETKSAMKAYNEFKDNVRGVFHGI